MRSSSYHPQSNGLVERFNCTLLSMLSLFVNENQTNWDCLSPYVMMAYRSSVHASTGFTPYKILFRPEIVLPLDVMNVGHHEHFLSASEYVTGLAGTLSTVVEAVKRHQAKVSGKQKETFDLRANLQFYSVVEWVWVRNEVKKKGICPKLQRRYRGPYEILKCISDVLYHVGLAEGGPEIVVHHNRLKSNVLSSLSETSAPLILPQEGAESLCTSQRVVNQLEHQSEVPLGASWVHQRASVLPRNLEGPREGSALVSAGPRHRPVQEPDIQEKDGRQDGSTVVMHQSKLQRPVRERCLPGWMQDCEMASV